MVHGQSRIPCKQAYQHILFFEGDVIFLLSTGSSQLSHELTQARWYNSIFRLVGGFKHFLCSIIYGIILPIDELIFFKMVIAEPTSGFLVLKPDQVLEARYPRWAFPLWFVGFYMEYIIFCPKVSNTSNDPCHVPPGVWAFPLCAVPSFWAVSSWGDAAKAWAFFGVRNAVISWECGYINSIIPHIVSYNLEEFFAQKKILKFRRWDYSYTDYGISMDCGVVIMG